jgi:hypothetical protein
MDKELLNNYCETGHSAHKIARLEGCSQSTVSRWLRFFGLTRFKPAPKKICVFCKTPLKKGESKFCSNKCQGALKKQVFLQGVSDGTLLLNPHNPQQIRRYILETREYRCVLCKLSEWNSVKIPLVVDHIDGNYMNCSQSNLRLICPNCDALLPTHKGKNRGSGRHSRRARYADKKSY